YLVLRDRLRRRERHRALDVGRDRIVGVQHVAEDRLDRGLHRLVVEVEGDGATGIGAAGLAMRGGRTVDEYAGAILLLRRGRVRERLVFLAGADVQGLRHGLLGAGDRLALQAVIRVRPDLGGAAGQHPHGADEPQRRQLLVHVLLSRRSNCRKPVMPALDQPPSSCWRAAARRRSASMRARSWRARASADGRSRGMPIGIRRPESFCAWRETIAEPCPGLCGGCVPSCSGALESGAGPGTNCKVTREPDVSTTALRGCSSTSAGPPREGWPSMTR